MLRSTCSFSIGKAMRALSLVGSYILRGRAISSLIYKVNEQAVEMEVLTASCEGERFEFRERSDGSEVSSLQVAPVAHVLLVSL